MSSVKFWGSNDDLASLRNAQDYSDFASNTFKQVANISQEDHYLVSDDDEASMDVVPLFFFFPWITSYSGMLEE